MDMRVNHLVLDIYFRCNRHVYICSYIAVQEKHLIVLNHVHCVLVVTKVLKISSILLCFFSNFSSKIWKFHLESLRFSLILKFKKLWEPWLEKLKLLTITKTAADQFNTKKLQEAVSNVEVTVTYKIKTIT